MYPNKNKINFKSNQAHTSPWLRCPSKSFPGKFYYFNVSTGETTWFLSETDNHLKKGPIHRVADKTHTYPEPFEPPDGSPTTTNSFRALRNPGNTGFLHDVARRPSPMFGQAVFPRYVPQDIFTPDYVWTLTPTYMHSQPQRRMPNQITQTYVPSNRFLPLKRPIMPAQSSTPFRCKEPRFAKPQMKDEACQTKSESRSVKNLTFAKVVEISTLSPSDTAENGNGKLNELDKNDLRLKLLAKKKKEGTVVAEKAGKLSDQSKPTKTQEGMQKKIVTDFQEAGTSDADLEDLQVYSPDSSPKEVEPHWYVVSDTETLLSELKSIEKFVKSDPSCRLYVPYAVYTELESRSRGAAAARQLLRKLFAIDSNVIVQSKPEYDLPSEDSIIECCWDLLQEDYHVVLVTNNKNVSNKADGIDLEHYTVDEIRKSDEDNSVPQDEIDNDNERPVVVEKYTKKAENLFLQDLKSVNGMRLAKPNDITDRFIDLTRPKKCNTGFRSDISNINNEIYKLNIIENSSVRNRTKKIINNAFDKINQDMMIFGTEKSKQNISVKNNVDNIDQNQKSRPKNIEISDETNLDIRRINMIAHNRENSRDMIKVSIPKLNKQFDLDEELQRFYVKNAVMENRIKGRIDEWVCRLIQTMEGALTDILLNEKVRFKRMTPPWNMFEAIQVTGETYKTHSNIKDVTDQFSITLLCSSSSNGKIHKDIKPNDFMKLVGFSVILIEHLKDIVDCKELFEADERLSDLIKNIEDSKTDIDLSLEKVNPPIFSRSDISGTTTPIVFRKNRTEILEYLRKHFEAWQSDADMTEMIEKIDNQPNILTTCGKNLNTLKINNTRAITLEKHAEKPIKIRTNKEEFQINVNNQPKVIRNVKIIEAFEERIKNVTKENNAEKPFNTRTNKEEFEISVNNQPKIIRNVKIIEAFEERIKNVTLEKNTEKPIKTQTDKAEFEINVNNEQKVIRNVKIIEAFEEKIKNRAQLDLDELDYEDNDSVYTKSDKTVIKSEKPDWSEQDFILDDLAVSESSTDTECVRAYPLFKIFLAKVKGTLHRVFNFIKICINEYQKGISMDKKADMKFKTEMSRQYMLRISERLKNIIERESGNGIALKHILIKAGDYDEDDHVMANYKETVAQFLRKTQILEEILEQMLPLFNAVSAKESDITYCPSNDTPSQILSTRLRS